MTSCPKCKGELEPRGYSPIIATPHKENKKILSIILYGILAVLLIIVLYERFFS